MPIIEGAYGPAVYPAAPVAGTDAVQTITFSGAAVSTGTFTLVLSGQETAPIPGSATPGTIVASIDSALELLPSLGTGAVVTAAGTYTAGAGTITVTFSGANVSRKPIDLLTVGNNSLTGSPTIGIATTTAGVRPTWPGAPTGALAIDTSGTGALLQNTGTAAAQTWTPR